MAAKTMAKTASTKRKREESVSARKIRVLEEEPATKQIDDMRSSDEDEDDEDEEDAEDGEEELDAAEIFRRHFEAKFKPLPDVKEKKKNRVVEEEEDDEDEECGGLSGESEDDDEEEESDEDDGAKRRKIDVVEHTSAVSAPKMSKAELKAFMSARPPSSSTSTTVAALKTPTSTDPSEKDNTANDLALHRLLTESHLLTSNTSSSHTSHTLEGTNRHRATDLRIQALGGKGSLFVQAKMPLHMRKGIAAKAASQEKGRREGAREG
ncbi:hypothetical protein V494_05547, partial [Pseudogymnoascus sp. VKM F-4513 (FW-928)]